MVLIKEKDTLLLKTFKIRLDVGSLFKCLDKFSEVGEMADAV